MGRFAEVLAALALGLLFGAALVLACATVAPIEPGSRPLPAPDTVTIRDTTFVQPLPSPWGDVVLFCEEYGMPDEEFCLVERR